MLRRLLNIASIVCLVACVALMGMWVRSYSVCDDIHGYFSEYHAYQIYSDTGRMEFTRVQQNGVGMDYWRWRSIWSETNDLPRPLNFSARRALYVKGLGFHFKFYREITDIELPFWFLVLTTGSLAMICRLCWPWRFKLRSLFIVTTFLAVVLGMIAWLDRAWIGK